MEYYKIEVVVPQIDSLQQRLQVAYEDGAAGAFRLLSQEDGVKIVFEREYSNDADFIEERMAEGRSLQQAVCEQLADELAESQPETLATVISALRESAVAFDNQGLPFDGYVGFVPQGMTRADQLRQGGQMGFFERVRDALQPRGSLPLVALRLKPAAYFDKDFVVECLNEVAKAAIFAQALGEPMSASHRLVLHVLADSSYIELERGTGRSDT